MITWRSFVIYEGLSQQVDVQMADVFQRVLDDVTNRLKWSGPDVVCDIVITAADELTFQEKGQWGKALVAIPASIFPTLSDRRKHLHLFALAVQVIDAVADGVEVDRVTYQR